MTTKTKDLMRVREALERSDNMLSCVYCNTVEWEGDDKKYMESLLESNKQSLAILDNLIAEERQGESEVCDQLSSMFSLGFKRGSLWAGYDVTKEPQCDEIIDWQLRICKEQVMQEGK